MKKSELISQLHKKYNNFDFYEIEKMVDIFFNTITKSLLDNKRIEIRGFGSFKIKINKAREARNPKTGEKITTKEKKSVHFKMGKILSQKVNQNK